MKTHIRRKPPKRESTSKKIRECMKFHDPELLREIFESRPDVDWLKAPVSSLLWKRFKHPEYSGTLIKLFYKTFGLQWNPRKQIRPAEDIRNFIRLALEDKMIEDDNRWIRRNREDLRVSGQGIGPEDMCDLRMRLEMIAPWLREDIPEGLSLTATQREMMKASAPFMLSVVEMHLDLVRKGVEVSYDRVSFIATQHGIARR